MKTESEEKEKKTDLAPVEKSQGQRFTEMVIKEFTGGVAEIALTNFQKRLVQNYFVSADYALKMAEQSRLKKSEQYRDALPVVWANINMELLARNVVSCARIGFDPSQANHINMIPYKNNTLKKYDIVFMEGYRGKELKAEKYGLDMPDDIIIELVFTTDIFTPIKKDFKNKVESYTFDVKNPFARGEVVGGFYYYNYFKTPDKNKLVIWSLADILKRKPEYASVEFWGGEKDKWVPDPKNPGKNKKEGKEKIEGWANEMYWKTIARAAYGSITIDSQKIDDDFLALKANEELEHKVKSDTAIEEGANKEEFKFDEAEIISETTNNNEQQPEVKQPETTIPTIVTKEPALKEKIKGSKPLF